MYCGQTVGWIKMQLGTEVGLGPGHIVLDGDPAPLPKEHSSLPPHFSAHFTLARSPISASAEHLLSMFMFFITSALLAKCDCNEIEERRRIVDRCESLSITRWRLAASESKALLFVSCKQHGRRSRSLSDRCLYPT